MAYARRNRKINYRRRRGRAGRRRFSKKRFWKRIPRALRAGLYIPKQAFVKLPFTQIIQVPELSDSNYNLPIWGMGITTPLTISPTGLPTPGDKLPLGVEQYANFYQNYRVLGASCKVQINNAGSTSGGSFYAVLISSQGIPYNSDSDSNYTKLINTATEDMISFPGASWRLISQQNGNRQNVFLKRWTKTKTILGIKDVRDNDETYGYLPGRDSNYLYGRNPNDHDLNWFFLLRLDPNLSSTIAAGTVQIILKVKYYVQLFGRDYNNQMTVPSE